MRNIFKLLLIIVSCFLIGWVGSIFTRSSLHDWYFNLKKPFFNPPAWIFAPVWTALYGMMGVAAFLVLKKCAAREHVRVTLILFYGQLLMNGFWSFLFFGLRSPFLAFIDILLLWVMIFLTMKKFFQFSKTAGWLFAPYLAWVSFAAVLNLSIVVLNSST